MRDLPSVHTPSIRAVRLGAVAALLLSAGLRIGAAQQGTGSISGRVLDPTTKRPLVGAQVLVAGTTHRAFSDVKGEFRLSDIAAGEVQLRARLIGYGTAAKAVTVSAGQTTTTGVDLGTGRSRLEGRVLGPEGPVPGAVVRVERLVNDASVWHGIPVVHGSIYRFEGQATVFKPHEGPCYRCLFPQPPPPELAPSCAEGGVLGVLPGIVGSLQANEALKLLLGIGEPLVGRLLLFDALAGEFNEVAIRRDPDCPVCGEHPTITEYVDYVEFCAGVQHA